MKRHEIEEYLNRTVEKIHLDHFSGKKLSCVHGKVRDIYSIPSELIMGGKKGIDYLLIFTSDRISAFDKVLTTIPLKGEVLNRISIFWFDKTCDIVENHIVRQVSARAVLVKRYNVLPVEVVIRGYLTGSAWRDYQSGKSISGIKLPEGMRFNEKLPKPLFTPSTKEERGKHDIPISREEIVEKGILSEDLLLKVERTALKLFERGSEVVRKQGLILVDTKYEFGLSGGDIVLIDELHTPDSSRFWYADTYEELFTKGDKQRKLDKEYLRQWLMEQGFKGDGEIPEIPDNVRIEVACRYIKAYEEITGKDFVPESKSVEDEIARINNVL
jgi:phosphoribosylaminoimidazole-succinocarboxamide synthase